MASYTLSLDPKAEFELAIAMRGFQIKYPEMALRKALSLFNFLGKEVLNGGQIVVINKKRKTRTEIEKL